MRRKCRSLLAVRFFPLVFRAGLAFTLGLASSIIFECPRLGYCPSYFFPLPTLQTGHVLSASKLQSRWTGQNLRPCVGRRFKTKEGGKGNMVWEVLGRGRWHQCSRVGEALVHQGALPLPRLQELGYLRSALQLQTPFVENFEKSMQK